MNLSGNLSSSDIDRVHDRNNPPENEGGFEFETSGDSDLDSIFDDFSDSSFGSGGDLSSGSTFGGNSFGGNNTFGGSGVNSFGGGSVFGGNSFGDNNTFGGNGSPFQSTLGTPGFGDNNFGGNQSTNGNQQNQQRDAMDDIMDASVDAAKSLSHILVEMFKSISLRNMDDIAYLGNNLIKCGAVMIPVSIVLMIVGGITGVRFISIHGISLQTLLCGIFTVGAGLASMGTAAFILEKGGEQEQNFNFDEIPDAASEVADDATDDFEENIGSEVDEAFSDDFDDLFSDFNDTIEDEPKEDEPEEKLEDFEIADDEDNSKFTSDGIVDGIQENQYITRELLYNTFKPMFPTKTPKFADKTEIDSDSDLFLQIETACLKAMSNIIGCELEQVNSKLVEAYDSFFSYELKMQRVRKLNKTDELAKEIEIYFRDDSEDTGVAATVTLEGDFYKIIISKGATAVVTFGDVFKQKYCEEFFLDTKKKLPMITGITELGKVIVDDAKQFDTMLIAGKPRSGKSWYVLSVLMCLMLFNSPEDVQFIIVDPKESNLFKTMALMPHVCGLHNDSNILAVMDDIIKVEGARRKKLLSDNGADDIWALREKGIRLPVLYLIIDEYITCRNNLGDAYKDLDKRLQTIISQLPSQGIRLVFVPHRATGIVDKTNRTMIQYSACVRSDISEVIDTLDIKKWNRPLTNPGDIAVKTATHPNATYVRGAALTTDDNQNTEFIRTAAKVFYKMGVDLPDMSTMTVAVNRDNEYIHDELTEDATRMQFNADNILKDI